MSGSFEKSVKGGTKIKLAAPKSKYVEHILVATHAGEAGVAEIFRALQNRLRDSTWTIVFKSLIIVHLMIREGEPQVTLKFLADSPNKLAISDFSDVQVQGSNIRHYYTYLLARAKAYRETRIDWVREGTGRLKKQTVDKGLLRETEIVQNQISALLKCDLLNNEPENEITLTAFRLLTMDLLVLFHVMNEGTINVLEHYFEMSKYDAKRALGIYKTFARQTNQVVEYLSIARTYENSTRLEIPKLKHAPTGLTSSLEEYLNDPDFENNRRQYLAQQEAQKGKKNATNGKGESSTSASKFAASQKLETNQSSQSPPGPPPPVKLDPKTVPTADLIDLFDSIEQNQQPMATQPQQQNQNFQQGSQFFPSPPNQQPQQLGFPPPPQGYPIQNGQSHPQISNAFPSPPQGFPAQNGQPQQQSSNPFPSSPQGFPTANGQPQQSTNPYGNMDSNPFGPPQQQQPLQQNYTGSGFSGYTQKPFNQQPDLSAGIQQQNTALLNFTPSTFAQPPQQQQQQQQQPQPQQQYPFSTGPQPQSTNPFRQSVMPQNTGPTSPSSFPMPPLPTSQANYQSTNQSTNPFARNVTSQPTGNSSIGQAPNSNNLNTALNRSNSAIPFSVQAPTATSSFPQASATTINSIFSTAPTTSSSFPLPPTQNQQQTSSLPPLSSQQQQQQQQPIQRQNTGTNPFARSNTISHHPPPPIPSQSLAPLVPHHTGGNTNPFRQSQFSTSQTPWQLGKGDQVTLGGLENLETVPVFPRPGTQQGQGVNGGGWS